jgi:hypothetical protein
MEKVVIGAFTRIFTMAGQRGVYHPKQALVSDRSFCKFLKVMFWNAASNVKAET